MMNRFIRLATLGVVLFCIFLSLSCGSVQPSQPSRSSGARGPVYMLCFTSPTLQVVRLSAVFPIKTVSPTLMLEEPWAADFRRFVVQAGNYGGVSVTCSQVTSKDAVKDKAEELRKRGHQVIETRWTYAN
jgi:hypothetical protein